MEWGLGLGSSSTNNSSDSQMPSCSAWRRFRVNSCFTSFYSLQARGFIVKLEIRICYSFVKALKIDVHKWKEKKKKSCFGLVRLEKSWDSRLWKHQKGKPAGEAQGCVPRVLGPTLKRAPCLIKCLSVTILKFISFVLFLFYLFVFLKRFFINNIVSIQYYITFRCTP